MDTMHWVLMLAALIGWAGAAWLLIERSSRAARLAATEAAVAAEVARREQAEHALERAGAELKALGEALAKAQANAASFEASLAAERSQREEERKTAAAFEERLKSAFGDLAGAALRSSSEQFLKLASQQFQAQAGAAGSDLDKRHKAVEDLVRPIRETLAKTEAAVAEVQKGRLTGEADIKARLEESNQIGRLLRQETANLVKALREPQVRGRYGELQLRRVAEIAGMRPYCDFDEQTTKIDADGNALRPDMIVRLPNGRQVVVDAKANLQPYLDAVHAATPEQAEAHLERFADGIEKTAAALAKKNYWKEFDGSAEFVVMFVPAERFLDEALSRRADLLERTAAKGVILVGPGSLIALLRAVHLGFQERTLSEKAREMGDLVAELHKRLTTMLEHAEALGGELEGAVGKWNKFAASLSTRLMPQIRAIEAAGVRPEKPVPEPATIQTTLAALPRAATRDGAAP